MPNLNIDALYRKYKERLIGLLKNWGCTPQEAEDLCSDTFLAAIEQDNFRGESTEYTWLSKISRYKMLTFKYNTRRQNKAICQMIKDQPPNDEHTIELLELDSMVDKLSPTLRSTMKLKLGGYTREEISEILDVHEIAVKSRLRDAKLKLQEMMGVDSEGDS